VPLVRQRTQGLHEQAHTLGTHAQLACLRTEEHSLRADDVADVPALERVVHRVPQRLLLQEELDLAGAIRDLGEARLAHDALGQHAAADVHARGIGFEGRRVRSP